MRKRKYIPKNIREGVSFFFASDHGVGCRVHSVVVYTHDHSQDMYGNGTAHYTVSARDKDGDVLYTIVQSGKKRAQVGYGGYNEAAVWALNELGYDLDLSTADSYDYKGTAVYSLKSNRSIQHA